MDNSNIKLGKDLKMQKAEREDIRIGPINGFSFIGDPGCSGLGVEIMSVFNAALHESGGDFVLVGGDIVPNGANRFYESVTAMVDQAIHKPIYMLAGNHDTLSYETFFGRKNYFLYNDNLLLIVLDDSGRAFSEEALALLRRALVYERDNIVLAFHIPPVNRVTEDSVSAEEWQKVLEIISPFKQKIKYILCGHIHSYFEDDIDGIKLIATGGGGARMDVIPGIETPYYHYVEFYFDPEPAAGVQAEPRGSHPAGQLQHRLKFVEFNKKLNTLAQPVRDALERAFAGECQAHVRYRLYAGDAVKNNKPGLAKLFLAAADSEYHHARNFFHAMNDFTPAHDALAGSVANESYEVETLYLEGADTGRQYRSGLAAYAFDDAREAEKVHLRLFKEAQAVLADANDIPEKRYYTCTSCGLTFALAGEADFKFCPVCGAPLGKIRRVEL